MESDILLFPHTSLNEGKDLDIVLQALEDDRLRLCNRFTLENIQSTLRLLKKIDSLSLHYPYFSKPPEEYDVIGKRVYSHNLPQYRSDRYNEIYLKAMTLGLKKLGHLDCTVDILRIIAKSLGDGKITKTNYLIMYIKHEKLLDSLYLQVVSERNSRKDLDDNSTLCKTINRLTHRYVSLYNVMILECQLALNNDENVLLYPIIDKYLPLLKKEQVDYIDIFVNMVKDIDSNQECMSAYKQSSCSNIQYFLLREMKEKHKN